MMKRILYILPLAVLIAGASVSCTKDSERINGMETRINTLENEKLVSLKQQIEGISATIADLGNLKSSIQALISDSATRQTDIQALRDADEALAARIAALQDYMGNKLSKYADKDLIAATYATLAQHNATMNDIEALRTSLGLLDAELSKDLDAIENSLSDWQTRLSDALEALTGRVDALERIIQSVTVIPSYSDESVTAVDGILKVDCVIEPASVVKDLTKENFALLLNAVRTKAAILDTLRITDDSCFSKDTANARISLKADVTGFIPEEGMSLMVAVSVRNGVSDYTTRFATVHALADDEKLKLADAIHHSDGADSFWEFNLRRGNDLFTRSDDASYPTLSVKTKSAYDAAFIEGEFEIESAVLATSATESVQYTGGVVTVTCTSSGTVYRFAGTATGEGVDDYDFYAFNVGVAASQSAGGAAITLLDKAASDASRVAVTGLSLDKYTLDMVAVNTADLTPAVTPANASNGFVTWTSSAPTVASVNIYGQVTALSEGTADITATTVDGRISRVCVVTVTEIPATSVSLDKNAVSIYEGGDCQLTATVLPSDASYKNLTWASGNPAVATVDGTGLVKGIAMGTTTITATGTGNISASCVVSVVDNGSFLNAFTVGAGTDLSDPSDDVKVHFSKGALNYNAGTGKFGFEADQYTCPAQNSERDADHLVHFYWSRTASVACSTAAYEDSGKAAGDILFTNTGASTANPAFTVSGKTGKYRALSKAEWVYLFEGRPDHDSKYGFGKVNGTNGIIILPDEFTDPATNGGSGAFVPKASSTGWNGNSYEGTGWTAMEEACAVFLPAAGNLGVSGIGNVGTSGYFWSSDSPVEAYNDNIAYCLYFGSSNIDPDNSNQRSGACPIRLVSE